MLGKISIIRPGLFMNDDTFCRGAYNFFGHLDWNHWLIHVFYLWVWVFSFDHWLVIELMPGIGRKKLYMNFIFESEFQFWSLAGDEFVLSLNLSFQFWLWAGFRIDAGDQKKKNRYVYFIFQSEFSVLINSFIFESFSFDHGQVLELMPGIRRRAGISGREVKLQLLPSSCHHHHHHQLDVCPSVLFCRLYWCDSGWWSYYINSKWWGQ